MDFQPRRLAFVLVVEVLQAVQVVQVPEDAGLFAVDLEGVLGLVAAGVAGGFEVGERAVGEVAHEDAGVVDADLFDLAGERCACAP